MAKKYTTVYVDRLTGKLVSRKKWQANKGKRYGGGYAGQAGTKRYVKQRFHRREERPEGYRYVIRKQTPKGNFRGMKWQQAKVEVSITSDHKLDRQQLESLGNRLAEGEELPDGIEVTLVEWTTGRKTKSYSSETDAHAGFSRFSEFFSEEIK